MTARGLALVAVVVLSGLSAEAHAQGSGLPRLHQFDLVRRDYSGNLQATDRDWFYTNLDGTSRPDGGGQHPSIEFDIGPNARPGPQVEGVAYVRAATAITVTATWRNESGEEVQGWLWPRAARLAVPAEGGGWEYVNLSFAPTGGQVFMLSDQQEKSFQSHVHRAAPARRPRPAGGPVRHGAARLGLHVV